MTVATAALDAPLVEDPDLLGISDFDSTTDKPWITIVWNDPINLMSYVTYVFQKHFGYSADKAASLMLDVHHQGRAVVSAGSREQMERDTQAMHSYGLWATIGKDE